MSRRLTFLVAAAIVPAFVLAQRNAVPTDPAKLLVIDCLLPGQVRQLGGQRTFLTARRPARLAATECEIRGGEYVAYDRANYETALAFWLPQAELGDAEAQAYVAEVYEKGLGTAPDYALAAQWYQRAADQGFERAQLSLAYLYEQGLGVTQDQLKALNLYREATGLRGDDLTYESEVTSARVEAQRIIDSLTAQLEDQNEALESLQGELAYTQNRLQERRTELQAAHSQVGELEMRLAIIERSPASPARAAELDRLESELRDREQQLAWRQREVADLETESAERRARLSQSFQEAADRDTVLQARLTENDAQRQALTEQLTQAQQSLYSTEQQVVKLTMALAEQRSQLATEREQLIGQSTSTSETQREALASREARLTEQQVEIEALQAEQRTYVSTIAGLREQARAQANLQENQQAELESTRAQLASAQQRLLETQQSVADLSGQLRQEREQIALERQQLDRREQATDDNQRQQIEGLYQQLATREARLAEQQTLIDTLQDESRYYVEQIARLRSQQEPAMAMRSIGASAAGTQIAPTRNLARDFDLGDYHALIIGNNSYDHLPRLDTAINDAQALETVLRQRYGFHTRLLINATRTDILVALNEYRASLEPEDSLLIYYAGHGELDQRNLRGYWLPVNAERNNSTEWISDQMITDQISIMAARHVLVVADSCYSGVMTRNSGLRLVAKGGDAAELRRLEKLAKLPSRTVLTSGGEQPVLDGGGGAHSIFANHLIEILTRNERVLEGSALYDTLFDRVRGGAAQFGIDQSPRYSMLADAGHLNGEFLFVPSI
jgi:hypothetical protein